MPFKKGNTLRKTGRSGFKKGTKAKKTILKETLKLNSTKDIGTVVLQLANGLLKDAGNNFNKRYLIFKELAKAGLPKTTIDVGMTFEEYLEKYE